MEMNSPLVSLIFFGGIGEIGGNKILLEDCGTRIFLDFGTSFASMRRYYGGYLYPRRVNGVGDYLEFDLVPRLKGLYSREMSAAASLKYSEPLFDAVFLSHAHADHCGLIKLLDPGIPVHCGETAKIIIDAVQETSSSIDFGEHDYRTFRTGDLIRVGNISVEPIHVDHSIPGAYGFIIHTSQGAVVYTGDLRRHGPMSSMTREFMEKARRVDPIAMICEGTRISRNEVSPSLSEKDVMEGSRKVVEETDKLVIVAFYGKDFDRFKTFYEVAKCTDRKFAVSMRIAALVEHLRRDGGLDVPDVKSCEDILVYVRRKRKGRFEEKEYFSWERPFLHGAVNFKYVKEHQSDLLFNLDLTRFTELIDVRPKPGGHFIHSMSEPFSDEDIEVELMNNWLEHFKLGFHQIHASGHCSPSDLVEMIQEIAPKRLLPVHSEFPEVFGSLVPSPIEVVQPKVGKESLL